MNAPPSNSAPRKAVEKAESARRSTALSEKPVRSHFGHFFDSGQYWGQQRSSKVKFSKNDGFVRNAGHYLGKSIIATPNTKKATDSSWNALSIGRRQISPKINRLSVQRSRKVKNGIFERNSFSMITSVFEMIRGQNFATISVCQVKAHRNMYSMTLKGQGQNLTSGQGHGLTQVAISVERIDETNTLRPLFTSLALLDLKLSAKKLLVTSGDLRRPLAG